MDTKITSASNGSFIGWDEKGYGPKGEHTRKQWREECIENLLAGKNQFDAWQDGWKDQINEDLENISFGFQIIKDDKKASKEVNTVYDFYKPYTLDFTGACFLCELLLNEYVFKQPTLFRSACFNSIANFQSAAFMHFANFESAVFNETIDFTESKFNSVSFRDAYFKKPIFKNTIFGGHYVNFDYCVFKSEVNFGGAQFPNNFMELVNISFYKSEFRKSAHFQNLNFKVKTNFKFTRFLAGVNFEGTSFNHDICFENVIFGDSNYDVTNEWRPKINFIDTKFIFDAKFDFAKFNLPTYFVKAEFFGDAEFNNATFNKDIRLFGAVFNGGAFFNDAVFAGDAVKRLGQMKKMAENNGQTDQALNFNALELDAKIKLPQSNISFNFITKLYKILSDYGRSFIIPLGWYFLLLWMSFLYAYGYTKPSDTNQITNVELCNTSKAQAQLLNLSRDHAAIEYALFRAGGLMDSTDAVKQNYSVNCKLFGEPIEPLEMRAWGVFKGIASIALLFLAALGLRNKYRIK